MPYNIVLLDDDYFVGREYIEQLNDSKLFCAIQAKSIEHLFDLIKQYEYDAVIVDIRMLDRNNIFSSQETAMGYRTGVAIYNKIKDQYENLLIVALTNDKHPEIINLFTKNETVAYFDKDVYRSINFPAALYSLLKKRISNDMLLQEKNHRRFKVGFSFPGEFRNVVESIVNGLQCKFKKSEILYDKFYTAEFARKNLDIYLQNLYHDQCDLIVVVLCDKYEKKLWCGIEWRAIRDFSIKNEDRLMFLKANNEPVSGVFSSLDGYINIEEFDIEEIVSCIIMRWEML